MTYRKILGTVGSRAVAQPDKGTIRANAIKATEFDNLPADELIQLISSVYTLKTGRQSHLHLVHRIEPKEVVDLSHILGGM